MQLQVNYWSINIFLMFIAVRSTNDRVPSGTRTHPHHYRAKSNDIRVHLNHYRTKGNNIWVHLNHFGTKSNNIWIHQNHRNRGSRWVHLNHRNCLLYWKPAVIWIPRNYYLLWIFCLQYTKAFRPLVISFSTWTTVVVRLRVLKINLWICLTSREIFRWLDRVVLCW